jgi:hypothetical protein
MAEKCQTFRGNGLCGRMFKWSWLGFLLVFNESMLKKVLDFRDFTLPIGFRSSITVHIGVNLVIRFVFSVGLVSIFKVI